MAILWSIMICYLKFKNSKFEDSFDAGLRDTGRGTFCRFASLRGTKQSTDCAQR